jgi:alkylation response protein AidB-like acyl-CoA dehydrogenase
MNSVGLTDLDLESLRKIVRSKVIEISKECDTTDRFPMELYEQLHVDGWLRAFVPDPAGGAGSDLYALAQIARELAYGSTGVFTTFTVNFLGMSPLLLYGPRPLAERLCSEFGRRLALWSYAMTEPDTGSEIAKTRTLARRVEGGYRLSGKKCLISNATFAEHMSVFARIEGSDPERPAITTFYVPGDSPGLTRGAPLKKLGQRDSNTSELYFDDVFVPSENRIGAEGQGLRIAFHCLQRSKILIAAAAVGVSDRARDLVVGHLRSRELYGGPLLRQPTIHHQLAQLETEAEAAWLLTARAAAKWSVDDFAVKEASMAKMFAANLAVKYVSEALELFGGYGFTREYEIEKLYRDVRVLEIYEGPTFVQQALIARELFPELKGSGKSERKAA